MEQCSPPSTILFTGSKTEVPIPLDKIIEIPKEIKSDKVTERYTILAVDDEPINLQVIVNHLKDLNYWLITANNGVEALNIVEKGIPDLILLDIMMPRSQDTKSVKRFV